MRTWLFLLAPLVVWAAHFLGVYGIASVAAVIARPDAPGALLASGALTVVCAAADGVLWAAARRRPAPDETARFLSSVAGIGALISLVAVLWQGLPVLLGR